jgi:hypothetical protein
MRMFASGYIVERPLHGPSLHLLNKTVSNILSNLMTCSNYDPALWSPAVL